MCHVRFDQVASAESTAERELSGENGGGDDAGEFTGILTRVCGMRSSDAEHVEHSCLRLQDGATSQGADFYRRHRDTDLEITTKTTVGQQCNTVPEETAYFFINVMQLALSTT